MLCSQHHEIYNVISYHFKFNLKCPFRIPEFKTTSIVTWPCGHIKLLIIKPYSKMYSTINMLLQENTNHLGSYIIMFIYLVHLGSEHLSSGSEHHACRASVIYSKHQGTTTHGGDRT